VKILVAQWHLTKEHTQQGGIEMTLDEMVNETFEYYVGDGRYGIDFDKSHILEAMRIVAKDFAREMCGKQKAICAKNMDYVCDVSGVDEYILDRGSILNAPLPEELK
jgi:hypothetical protein